MKDVLDNIDWSSSSLQARAAVVVSVMQADLSRVTFHVAAYAWLVWCLFAAAVLDAENVSLGLGIAILMTLVAMPLGARARRDRRTRDALLAAMPRLPTTGK